MIKTAGELISRLEAGDLLATGDPDHVMFLRYEMWERDGVIHRYLGAYGWASALGTIEGKVMRVLREPEQWVAVPNGKDAKQVEAAAKTELQKLGRWVDYEWEWTVRDERPANTKN